LALGLNEEATANAAVLGHNYPGSEWYVDAYSFVTSGTSGTPAKSWFARNIGSAF
jgi:outer membrane protein assembly factor BamD